METVNIPATPYARKRAKELKIDLNNVQMSAGRRYLSSTDVEAAALDGGQRKTITATPLARRAAQMKNIQLGDVFAGGKKIWYRDILAYQTTANKSIALQEVKVNLDTAILPMSAMRRTIAKRMTSCCQQVPMVVHVVEADVTEMLLIREKVNNSISGEGRVSVNDFMIKAAAMTVNLHDRFCMRVSGDGYEKLTETHIGMAVGLDDGLIVPVVRNAGMMSLFEIAAVTKRLAGKARSGGLTAADMGNACITVSNLGMYGTVFFTPIINQPEAAILGIGAAHEHLRLINGQITARKIMAVSLTYDHRVVNGTEAAAFSDTFKSWLENPIKMIL